MDTQDASDVETLDPAAVQKAFESGHAQIVDVRLPFDFFGGRVPGSTNLPGLLVLEHRSLIPEGTKMIFVCDDGSESTTTAKAARRAGFAEVAVLGGGIDAWLDADLPVETISDGNTQV